MLSNAHCDWFLFENSWSRVWEVTHELLFHVYWHTGVCFRVGRLDHIYELFKNWMNFEMNKKLFKVISFFFNHSNWYILFIIQGGGEILLCWNTTVIKSSIFTSRSMAENLLGLLLSFWPGKEKVIIREGGDEKSWQTVFLPAPDLREVSAKISGPGSSQASWSIDGGR